MEESTDETLGVKAAISPTSVGSPPRTRACLEMVQEEEEEAAAEAEKTASVAVVRTPPVSPSSLLVESLARELFLSGQDQALPEARPVGRQEAEQHEAAGLVEKLLASAHRAAESAEVSTLFCCQVVFLRKRCLMLIVFLLSVPGQPEPSGCQEAVGGAGRWWPT